MPNRGIFGALACALLVQSIAFVPAASANVTATTSVAASDNVAGGHGDWTFTATYANGSGTTETLRRAIYDLPAGLTYNPGAIAAADICPQATFDTGVCGAASQVGTISVSVLARLGILTTTITDLPGTISVIGNTGGTLKLGILFSDAGSGLTLRATEQLSVVSGNVRWATDDLPRSLTSSGQTAAFQITKLQQKLSGKLAGGANFLTNPATCGTWTSFGYTQAWDSNTNANSDPLSSGSNQFLKTAALNITGTCPVDSTPPAAPNVTGPAGTATTTSASIIVTPAEAGGTVQGSLDSAAFASITSPVSLTNLAQGNHTYSARQIDAAGNVGSVTTIAWSVDSIAPAAPTLARSNPTANPASSVTQTIGITPAESGGTIQGKLDGASFAAVTSPVNLSALSNGSHTYQARQLDAAGNIGAVGEVTWTVDTVAPAAPTLSGPTGTVTATTASIGITPAESGGKLEGKLDGASFATVTSPVALSGLSSAAHTYQARQVDAAGNAGAVASINWTVNTSVPAAPTIDSGPSGATSSTNASFAFSSSESGVTFETNIDSAGFVAGASPATYSSLAQGGHSFAVRAKNSVGTTGPATTRSWTVDTVAPGAPTVGGPSGTLASASASVTITPAESGGSLQGSLDGAAFALATSPVSLSGLSQGSHKYQARQIDAAGNVGAVGEVTWSVDTIAPAAPGLTGPNGTVTTTSASIEITPAESGGSLQGKLDGASFATVTSSVSLTGLSNGQHTYSARQVDNAGNLGSAASITWTIDNGIPLAPAIDSGPGGPVKSASASFSFSSSESGVTFETNLDGAGFVATTSPTTYSGLSEGGHSFAVRAKNAAGTTGPSTSRSWTVDTIAPAAPTLGGPSGTVVSTSASITITPAESGGSLQGKLDAAAFATASSPVSLTGLSSAAHTYEARQIDAAGNVGPAASITWTVNASVPNAPSIDSGPTGQTNSASAAFGFSSSESGVTFETSLDGAGFVSNDSPANYSGLSQGGHSFAVRAKNAVGTTGPSTTRNWTVDTVAPGAPNLSGPSGTVAVTSASIGISPAESGGALQGRLDGASFASVTSPASLSGLSNGSHTYEARQIDAAGNTGLTASITWIVDTTPPVDPPSLPIAPAIDSGPAGLTKSTSANFAFSSSESGVTFEASLDGAAFADATSPKSYSGLAQGNHTFSVRAKNSAGAGPPSSRSWTVDTVAPAAPTVTRTNPTATPTTSTSQALTIGNKDSGATLEGRLDAAAFAGVGTTVNLTGLASGSHTYQVRQVDAAGNVSAVGQVTWSVSAPSQPGYGSFVDLVVKIVNRIISIFWPGR
jgi:multisubunit Na+/H+ antiporter MnhG subunit